MNQFRIRPLLAFSVLLLASAPLPSQTTPSPTLQKLQKEQQLAREIAAEAKKEMATLQKAGKPDAPAAQSPAGPSKDVAAGLHAVTLAKEESMKAMSSQDAASNPQLMAALRANRDTQATTQNDLILLQKMMERNAAWTQLQSTVLKSKGDALQNIVSNMR